LNYFIIFVVEYQTIKNNFNYAKPAIKFDMALPTGQTALFA